MIPANRRRNQRNKLQQQRSRNGKQWEEDLCEELNAAPNSWARCWPKAWAGQPFDISAMVQGAALGIECKAVQRGNLPLCTQGGQGGPARTPAVFGPAPQRN